MQTIIIREGGLVATFYRPLTPGKHPGIIVVGGAGGGIVSANAVASLLRGAGYATLALAYFGIKHLPPRLEEIPLEYFKQAIDVLRSRPSVVANKIGILGTSKGGEAALLISATYREITAVAAYSPSHVAFQGVAEAGLNDGAPKSSWTVHGKPVPFVSLRIDRDYIDRYGFYLGLHLGSLHDRDACERAVIAVEHIKGDVLLISGTDDAIWPASMMCEQIIKRLRKHQFAHDYQHLQYKGAGHLVAGPNHLIVPHSSQAERLTLGGSACVNAAARDDAWTKVIDFFNVHR